MLPWIQKVLFSGIAFRFTTTRGQHIISVHVNTGLHYLDLIFPQSFYYNDSGVMKHEYHYVYFHEMVAGVFNIWNFYYVMSANGCSC